MVIQGSSARPAEQRLSVDAAAIIPNAGNFAAPALLEP
jgi:hypothetical protein